MKNLKKIWIIVCLVFTSCAKPYVTDSTMFEMEAKSSAMNQEDAVKKAMERAKSTCASDHKTFLILTRVPNGVTVTHDHGEFQASLYYRCK